MNETSDSGFVLAESVTRNTFGEDIYAHLGALAAVEFSRAGSLAQAGTFQFNASKYESLEQAAFEEAPRMEARPPQPVNWVELEGEVAAFQGKLTKTLSTAQNTGDTSAFVQFSSKCFENFMIYEQMYPRRDSGSGNPWSRPLHLMKSGRFLIIGDESQLRQAKGSKKAVQERERDKANVVALVKGAAAKPASMPIDNRFALQSKLLAFLKTNARGHANVMPLKEIAAHLPDVLGIPLMKVSALQTRLMVSLKRAGVVGSSTDGCFFIDSQEDLIKSYCFHRTKFLSVDKIMTRYQAVARQMDQRLDLEVECGRSGPILNKRL